MNLAIFVFVVVVIALVGLITQPSSPDSRHTAEMRKSHFAFIIGLEALVCLLYFTMGRYGA
jgi:hypothetical protein